MKELHTIVDNKLPFSRPAFQLREVDYSGSRYDFYYRDIVESIRALFRDPEFAPFLVFVPERHYTDAGKTSRLYHDMHTGNWWWATQV